MELFLIPAESFRRAAENQLRWERHRKGKGKGKGLNAASAAEYLAMALPPHNKSILWCCFGSQLLANLCKTTTVVMTICSILYTADRHYYYSGLAEIRQQLAGKQFCLSNRRLTLHKAKYLREWGGRANICSSELCAVQTALCSVLSSTQFTTTLESVWMGSLHHLLSLVQRPCAEVRKELEQLGWDDGLAALGARRQVTTIDLAHMGRGILCVRYVAS